MKSYLRLTSTASYLPKKVLTNQDVEKICDTTDEWIVTRTGIRQRHMVTEEESTARMALTVARGAVEKAGIDVQQIDLIVVATATPERIFPSTACYVQNGLGIRDCIAFDVQAACAGFLYALAIANDLALQRRARHVLVIGSESLTRAIDWADRNVAVLFGDGAGAALLSLAETPGIVSTHLHSDATRKDILYLEFPDMRLGPTSKSISLQMQGKEVFKSAVECLVATAEEALAGDHLTVTDIDWLIPHQANVRIIQAVAKKLELPMEKVIVATEQHANTSAASIPLALDSAIQDGRIKRGHRLLLEAIGGGLVWGSVLMVY